MIQDTAWSPRFVPSTTATAATSGEAIAGTDTTKFITPSLLPSATSYHAGPVVNGRAPRQGLVFDGTGAATVTTASIGTADFTLAAWVNPVDWADRYIFGIGASYDGLYVNDGTGELFFFNGANVVSGLIIPIGKTSLVTVRRSSGTLYFGLNGIETAGVAMGTSLGAVTKIGDAGAGGYRWNGVLSGALAYNRALSASEVVSLYEAGAPAGADYNGATNTALNTNTFENSNIYPYGTFSGASATGFTAVSNGTGFQAAYAAKSITFKIGTKYRLTYTLTLNSGAAPFFVLGNPGVAGYSAAVQLSAGTNSVEVTATATGTSPQGFGFQHTASAGNYSISNISLVPVGLLLAPDAAQAGGGLTWYDTSGNAANISWTSGVSWNVPFAGYVTAPTTTNLTLAGGSSGASLVLGQGTNGAATLTSNGSGRTTFTTPRTNTFGQLFTNSGTVAANDRVGFLFGFGGLYTNSGIAAQILDNGSTGAEDVVIYTGTNATGAGEAARFKNTGNFLIGGPTDSSNGNLQLKDTSGSSTKGIGFGTDVALFRSAAGALQLETSATAVFEIDGAAGNTRGVVIQAAGTEQAAITVAASGTSLLLSTGSPRTTALTLDSSQRAQFAGNIGLGAAPLANIGVRNSLSLTASGGSAYVYQSGGTLTSAANNDSIFGLSVDNAYSNAGSYTNVSAGHLVINARSFSGFAFGYGIRIGNITGATSNFAIRTGSGIVSFEDTTASTTTGTGALQVSGGAGIAGAVNVGTYYGMVDGVTAPSATSGYAKIYVDTADGDLKVIFGDGTIKTIATDT